MGCTKTQRSGRPGGQLAADVFRQTNVIKMYQNKSLVVLCLSF